MADCMSWNFFLKCAKQIIEVSDRIEDEWVMLGNKAVEGGAYLVKTEEVMMEAPYNASPIAEDPTQMNDEFHSNYQDWYLLRYTENAGIPDGEDASWERLKRSLLKFEYHVTYHISYGVPVLSFNAWKPDGSLLTLEEAWKVMHPIYKQRDMYTALTQMDHTVLRRPFLTLHPCKTSDFVSQFMEVSKNPVVTWLSSVGPAIHLNLPLKMVEHLDDI